MNEQTTEQLVKQVRKLKHMVGGIAKNDKNTFHKYRFRGVDAVMEAVAPAFAECDLTTEVDIQVTHYDTSGTMVRATAQCTIVLRSLDGGRMVLSGPGEGMDKSDKAVMKAASVAYRDTLLRGLQIPFKGVLIDSESEN